MNTDMRRHRPRAASRSGRPWDSTMARISWVVLLAISTIGVLNHLVGVFTFATGGEQQLTFALFTAVNAYATAVLLFPYRRHRRWAWLVTWLEVAAFASVLPLTGGGVGRGYLVVAAIAGLAQLATLPEFWPSGSARDERDGPPTHQAVVDHGFESAAT